MGSLTPHALRTVYTRLFSLFGVITFVSNLAVKWFYIICLPAPKFDSCSRLMCFNKQVYWQEILNVLCTLKLDVGSIYGVNDPFLLVPSVLHGIPILVSQFPLKVEASYWCSLDDEGSCNLPLGKWIRFDRAGIADFYMCGIFKLSHVRISTHLWNSCLDRMFSELLFMTHS